MQSRTRSFLPLFLFALVALLVPGGLLAAQAQIAYMEGAVGVERSGAAIGASIGMPLETGDFVVTGATGIAVVALTPQTTIKTRENTRVRIDALGDNARVNLTSGGLFSRILGHLTGTYEVTTPTAVAGVRGTEFFIAYGRTVEEAPDLWLCVNSGTVAVSIPQTGKSVSVPAGKGINILSGTTLTDPRAYKWTKNLNWNMDPAKAPVLDNTKLDQAYTDLLNQDYN